MTVPEYWWANSIVLSAARTRLDMSMAATIADVEGRTLADVRSVDGGTWQRIDRLFGSMTARYALDVVSVEGTTVLSIVRPARKGLRDRLELLEIRDGTGAQIGVLRQANGYLSGPRRFAIEAGARLIGHTGRGPDSSSIEIKDGEGPVLATITATPQQGSVTNLHDYTMNIGGAADATTKWLCLAAAIGEYFYDRVDHGGPMRALLWWS